MYQSSICYDVDKTCAADTHTKHKHRLKHMVCKLDVNTVMLNIL